MIDMSSLPHNIRTSITNNKNKMLGNPSAILKIKQSTSQFNKLRQQSSILQKIEIFPYEYENKLQHDQLYVVKIKGRKNTYYQGRILRFYIFIFDNYPQEPPEIMVPAVVDQLNELEKPFLHLNMSSEGHVCMLSNQKDKQYFKNTTLKDILIQLESMIYSPNISSSYPSELFTCYKEKGDNSQYFQKLNNQAKYLQSFEDDESSDSDSESDDD